ncbi:sterol carrier protein domain-containing protein [Fodinicola feengrottensis]|uniref:sterol carrier protein domain-containing protein n=1 Tax=Fodinicola feengrottensis TaxID=435914 RepID=UPI0024410C4A|nr:sterol carrier protein domain-containing protein [Fodinicola feengrottensis]
MRRSPENAAGCWPARRGPFFDSSYANAQALPSTVDGLSLVEDGEKLVGYATWQRGEGWGPQARLDVMDLLALTPEAAREVVGVLGSWRSIVGVLRLRPLAFDAVSAVLPLESSREAEYDPWMHRPVDVVAAVRTRGWPSHVRASVDFVLEDRLAPWNAGSWRLEIADGQGNLERTDRDPGLRLKVNGFAMLYAGACDAESLVGMGHLEVTSGADPTHLDPLGSAGQAQLLNHF